MLPPPRVRNGRVWATLTGKMGSGWNRRLLTTIASKGRARRRCFAARARHPLLFRFSAARRAEAQGGWRREWTLFHGPVRCKKPNKKGTFGHPSKYHLPP